MKSYITLRVRGGHRGVQPRRGRNNHLVRCRQLTLRQIFSQQAALQDYRDQDTWMHLVEPDESQLLAPSLNFFISEDAPLLLTTSGSLERPPA